MKRKIFAFLGSVILVFILAAAVAPFSTMAASKKTVYVISSITVKKPSGATVDTIKYSYNKHGMVSKRVWTQPGGRITFKYKYDSENHLVENTQLAGKKKASVTKYKYEDGVLTSAKASYILMKDKETITYEYDDAGRLIYFDGSSSPDVTLKYNAKGQLIRNDSLFGNKKYKYDKKGNVTKQYDGKKVFRIYKNTYTSKKSNRLKKVVCCYKSGKKICTNHIKYKKIKVSAKDAEAVKKQQVTSFKDPVFEMFPF